MPRIFEAVFEYFQSESWKFAQIPDQPILRMGFSGQNGNWTCYAQTREEEEQFIFYSVLPNNAPEAKRAAISEFITRANYNLVVGNFEMDFSDGEIRYKTSMNLSNVEVSHPLLHGVIVPNIFTTERFFPGVMAVLFANASPEDAIIQVRNTPPGGTA
jgi:hypothetical protein